MKRVVSTPAADGRQFADPAFSATVVAWQKQHGRHALPWQNTRDAYRIWLSEIMLQQTQVTAVIPYYQRFLQRFPDVATLAAAPAEDVMAHWSGLGYYTRARNLHRCAQIVMEAHGGSFPADPALLAQLPGIGRSTAAAIAAFAYGARAAILDGNVKRVFARVFGIDAYPGEKRVEDTLWLRAEALLPEEGIESYTQGLMDLGATLCTRSRPSCERCPLAPRCIAFGTARTAELPVRKPKKAVPEKHAAMLVVEHEGHILLQQRPDSGIWGGLLSLPEVGGFTPLEGAAGAVPPLPEDALRQATAPFGEPASSERLPAVVHVFTHFKLHIIPYRVHLARRLPMAAQGGHVWLPTAALAQAPLPAPIKKLLLGM
ncbi:MAG TPA: A/G-specific adenine glycosylase [Oxalobacteraceae bacterium]|nr:A/G-specific adenine glycosylase [Oxalobacteraceae bacterium]